MTTFDPNESLHNQIYLLKAENERLVQENQAYKQNAALLEQKIESLTSLLTMYQLNELSVYPKERSSDSRRNSVGLDSLPQVVDRLISRNNLNEDQEILNGLCKKNVLKMGDDIMVLQRHLDYLKLEVNFMIQELKSSFENMMIEIRNKTKDYQMRMIPERLDKRQIANRAQHSRHKLEKLVDIFDNIQ